MNIHFCVVGTRDVVGQKKRINEDEKFRPFELTP